MIHKDFLLDFRNVSNAEENPELSPIFSLMKYQQPYNTGCCSASKTLAQTGSPKIAEP
ncbi:hypothetical protein Metal_0430 [Methylomicrobium album BG8]|uniref:Uncharacterized protein n=1 Tax=Methylomicrobium album BG8 TaxID=686340 RepID=H8GMP4_METAL|nr:hypothetical protein Metal_0430 [Methylomicrobium album BG8]